LVVWLTGGKVRDALPTSQPEVLPDRSLTSNVDPDKTIPLAYRRFAIPLNPE
jgi:hypothetical protein